MSDNVYEVPGRELDRLIAENKMLRERLERAEAERELFAAGIRGYEEVELAIRRGDLSDEEGLVAYRAHTASLAGETGGVST